MDEPSENDAAVWPAGDSLADVRRIAGPHPAILPPDELSAQCRMTQMRRGGPGGQHRNKVSTAIGWMHEPTGISAEASESRDQNRNRQEALKRLRLRLAIRLRGEALGPEEPAGAEGRDEAIRRLGTERRLKVSAKSDDYPAVLAMVLDDLHCAGGQPSLVGRLWQASTTSVVSLVADCPAALQEVNRWRAHHGRGPLRR